MWESGQHSGLVGYAETKGAAREGRVTRGEGDEDVRAWQFHGTVLFGKLRQVVQTLTTHKGGGCLLPGDVCKKTKRLVADVLEGKHPDTRTP